MQVEEWGNVCAWGKATRTGSGRGRTGSQGWPSVGPAGGSCIGREVRIGGAAARWTEGGVSVDLCSCWGGEATRRAAKDSTAIKGKAAGYYSRGREHEGSVTGVVVGVGKARQEIGEGIPSSMERGGCQGEVRDTRPEEVEL
ncbi:hypothetical protein GOP47_0019025 [Adiantum capillus-veneris]|uniref:Uncharacterized protein n=1 Tax=Adiantum capillus-veneris TaxID=13818 RepID=A0A9D4ZB87_ADICA|nr:hypothetical protein GOP47_0019025 [Adiantum capillus-veneris]